ncbi:MAG: nucleotide exchange factor GrpE [Candidatus Nanopelagicaceae bacterium]|nr:nucleotide exchange factor GrpE [Candidatus Nanopelagicaceae bacterium]
MSSENESLADEVIEDLQSEAVESDLAVLTGDLQRLQAEYINYRKRVERDRSLSHELAVGAVLAELLPVLDDLDRAREHGELSGGFKAVADRLVGVTTKIGLEQFGEVGTTFDPQIHEALSHTTSSEVSETTATAILQPGYKYKNRILRPARVAVTDPE